MEEKAKPVDIRERSFEFAVRIVKMCQSLQKIQHAPKSLITQILKSGTSIGANIEEAQGSQSKADFTSKMSIACKEARETHYWLRLFAASNITDESKLQPLTEEANELIAILTTIVKKTRTRPSGQ